jgi:hypothetical protein
MNISIDTTKTKALAAPIRESVMSSRLCNATTIDTRPIATGGVRLTRQLRC